MRIIHCKTPRFCTGKHDTIERKKVQTAQYIPEKYFFPCLLTTVERLTQQGLTLNLMNYKWLLPLDKMHPRILCIPALCGLSAGAERWALVRHAVNLCKSPVSVSNYLFRLKTNLLNPQMWSAARWILRNSHLKSVYQVTSSNIIWRFRFSSQCTCQGHPFGSSAKSHFQNPYTIRKLPPARTLSPKAPYTSVLERSAELVFLVKCMRSRFGDCTRKGENQMENSREEG